MKIERMKKLWLSGLIVALFCLWSLPALAGVAKLPPTGPWDAVANAPSVPDYFSTANWAYSPPLTKFVDRLPGLTAANANTNGQYLPVATPDITTYPGSDYYEIELIEYSEKMHSDLPPTRLRGYRQTNKGTDTSNCGGAAPQVACTSANLTVDPPPIAHYLGPIIVSTKDRPVRIKFTNRLPNTANGGDLFLPVDKTFMGAGAGPLFAGASRGLNGGPCASDTLPAPPNYVENAAGCAEYPQNRATIHLHGGRTPWISDGTPHQWITPADENTPYPKGVSVRDVPDMPQSDPLDGSQTFFYSNQQTARLMFYHDHAFGTTRLNVYVGEAAGYLVTDKWEQDLVTRGILPADQIPLVIQDRTFVDATPFSYTDAATGQVVNTGTPTVRIYDPLWNWGTGAVGANGVRAPQTGDLWMPHVYMTNQNPYNPDNTGTNAFGRWFYGPWFYPPTVITVPPLPNPYFDADCADPTLPAYATCTTPGQPPVIPGTPHPSSGMEAFMDTAIVNGTAFPVLEVDPKPYRFRILNAANDRGLNLSIYKADMTLAAPAGPNARIDDHTEVKMVPAAPPVNGDVWPPLWPIDGRLGGVPDPGNCTFANNEWSCPNWGPKFIQIGTEGGFLPAPAVRDPQPVTWVTNPAAFWVGVVQDTGLALMPAERADVVVDFSQYAGQTLIVYNDGPTAWPALDPRYDFMTGYPDMRDTGGYGVGGTYDAVTKTWTGGQGVLAGFGPNTRTVMQIKVRAGAPVAFNKAALDLEFTNAAPVTALNPVLAVDPVGAQVTQIGKTLPLFQRAQEPIVALQNTYQNSYPAYLIPGANTTWGGIRHSMLERSLNFLTVEGKKANTTLESKAMHDEMGASFDKIYGRMQSNLGMEIPNPTTNNANMIIYGYQDKPSELIGNSVAGAVQVNAALISNNLVDGTQIWNISHNGVDTHPIHFHIFDVQLINRMGWDGMLALPDPNELGWKDTVRISPLMDTIVALRPVAPLLPFGIPDSNRPLNPALPINSAMGFSQVDWMTNAAFVPPVANIMTSFGWEYVWHCHILSHEEMDMMRPIVLTMPTTQPPAPTALTASAGAVLNWTDMTAAATAATLANQQINEIGFKIERCTAADCSLNSPSWGQIGTALANATTYTDATATTGVSTSYRVAAYNQTGTTYSDSATVIIGSLTKPTISIATNPVATTYAFGAPIVIDATVSANVSTVDYYVNGGLFASTTSPFSTTINNASSGTLLVTAIATNVDGVKSLVSNTLTLTVYGVTAAPAAITVPVGSSTGDFIVSWTASTNVGATYVLEESTDDFVNPINTVVVPPTAPETATSTSRAITGKTAGIYYYRVKAQNPPNADSTWTPDVAAVTPPAIPAHSCTVTMLAPPAWILVPAASSNGIYSVTWGTSTTPDASYILEESTNGFTSVTGTYLVASPGIVPPLPATFSYSFTGKANGTYSYRVRANLVGAAAPSLPTVAKSIVVTLATPAQKTITLPDFSQSLLTGAAQSPWENVLPNALADYFTYVPLTTVDADALGFPAGVCANVAKGDFATIGGLGVTTTEDCYIITVKNVPQALALPGIFGGGSGLLDAAGNPAPVTNGFGYGSGGLNWTPPGLAAAVTGNAPTPFATLPANGGLTDAGIWHFPAPTIKGTTGRPVRVTWLNELTNTEPNGLDPSVDCGPNAPNCFPYNRIVTHVHGAHVGPESDGLASAWFTPGFVTKGEDWASTAQFGPEGTYRYPMDQEASTIWYHDHAMGTTHNNTNMGMAGFFPITDINEKALITAGTLPPAAYELGFALQDRHITTGGQFMMPDFPTYDRTTPGCVIDAVTNLPDPATCTLVKWMKDPVNGNKIPYDNVTLAGKAILADPINAAAPFGATSATLEYFGNIPMVNGVTYGKYNIEPRVYRMRFIGGTDSRTWVMQLQRKDTDAIIPIYVIGSEQGLLNAPVARNELDLMPGERVDVLVDFTGIPMGTRIIMNNLGSDTPWAGYDDYKAQSAAIPTTWVRSTDIPEIMAFDVTQNLDVTKPNTAPTAITALRSVTAEPGSGPIVPLPAPANIRNVSLMEITDGYGRTMPTIDSRGFKPVGIPVTEIIKLNDVEQWDIINTTVDAHPMHLHQVAFQVIDRQALVVDPTGTVTSFTPPVDDIINQVFTPPAYTVDPLSTPLPPEAWEMGWKDTITSPPGYVTRVIARFDITGEYVWHCHILSHEEHDMMRNFIVTDAAFAAPAPQSITVPASSVSGSYTVEWIGTAIPGVTYELQEALNGGTFASIYTGAAPRFDVINRAAGSYTYQVRALAAAGFTNSAFRVGANAAVVDQTIITAPTAGAVLVQGTAVPFSATAPAGATRVEFFVNGVLLGTDTTAPYSVSWTPATLGANNLTAIAYFSTTAPSASLAVPVTVDPLLPVLTINALPAAIDLGTPTTVTATTAVVPGVTYTQIGLYFSEVDPNTNVSTFLSWANPGSTSITWTPAVAGARALTATAYYVGFAAPVTSAVAPVTINGTVIAPASITVPANNNTGSYTVSWAASGTSGVTYTLEESTDPTFATGVTTTTNAVSPVSINRVIFGTYYYRVKAVKLPMTDSNWTGTAPGNGCLVSVPSSMISPLNNTALTGASGQVFSWVNTGATSYQLWVGSTFASNNLAIVLPGTATSTTVQNLPINGSTIYVRLYSQFGATMTFRDYVYTTSTLAPAAIITPIAGSTLTSASQTFTWNDVGATGYQMYVGKTLGNTNIAIKVMAAGTTSTTVTNIPIDGSTVYVKLLSQLNGVWYSNSYTYTAANQLPAAMVTPVNATILAGSSQTFTWNNVVGATGYQVYVGTTLGNNNIATKVMASGTTTTTVTNIPTNGGTIYVKLLTQLNGVWYSNSYTYTASTTLPAAMITPVNAAILAGASQTFTWNNVAGATGYQMYVGTTLGNNNIATNVMAAGTTSTTVTNLPTNGSTIYVKLLTQLNGVWQSNSYTYTAFGP